MPVLDPGSAGQRHTVASALRELSAELNLAGIEGPGGDVRRLLAEVLDTSSAGILREPERGLSPAQLDTLRRLGCAPQGPRARLAHPRQARLLRANVCRQPGDARSPPRQRDGHRRRAGDRGGGRLAIDPVRILDVGTGTGCLLATLLCELPAATGLGSDISEAALATARDNARRLGVDARTEWKKADALEGIAGPFHMLVANPPYVRTAEIADLEPEVRNFDPVLALDGGIDGLAVYRRLLERAWNVIADGWIVLEVGHDQAHAVTELLAGQHRVDKAKICVRSGCRRKETLCCSENTRLSISQKPLGFSAAAG